MKKEITLYYKKFYISNLSKINTSLIKITNIGVNFFVYLLI